MGNPVVHWEIGAGDANGLVEFYGKLFDWKIQKATGMDYHMVETVAPGTPGGLNGGIMQVQPGVPPFLTFYIQVDDLQAHLDKAQALGGRVIMPSTPIPGIGSFAMFQDPQGNAVGIYKQLDPK